MKKMAHDQRVLAHQQSTESASQVAAPAPPDQHGDAQSNQGLTKQKSAVDQHPASLQVAGLIASDNATHRVLFSLPPIKLSEATGLAVPELPPQRIVTGDHEVDAVIWLREVIGTGQPALIDKAKKAAKKIKTPFKDLEKRYTAHLARASGGNPFATLASMGFADLEDWEKRSIETAAQRDEARARFGESPFEKTAAEAFAETTLAGVEPGIDKFGLDDMNKVEVDTRFDAALDQRPATLTDCLVELKFWSDLYWLRNAIDRNCSDTSMQAQARKDYAFRCLARIRPRSTAEAHEVLQYLIDDDAMNWDESPDILRNLMTNDSAGTPARTVVAEQPKTGLNLELGPVVEGDQGGAGIAATSARAEAVLRRLDSYMAASGYDTEHPWRREITGALTTSI